MKRYPNFDLLRLFLAGEVVVFHIHSMLNPGSPVRGLVLSPVPAFLAISGFLVLASLQRGGGYGHFWWKRALRVVPAFALGLLLVLVLEGIWGVGQAMLGYISFGQKAIGNPDAPLWSLSFEEVFYALMCLLALVGFYKNRNLVLAAGLISAYVYGYAVAAMGANPSHWEALVPSFFVGCWFLPSQKISNPLWAVLFLLIGTVPWHYSHTVSFIDAVFPAIRVLAAAYGVLLLGCGSLKLPAPPIDISYGLYIYHFPILYWMITIHHMSGTVVWLLGIGIPVVISIASAYLIERPALRLKGRPLLRGKPLEGELSPAASVEAAT